MKPAILLSIPLVLAMHHAGPEDPFLHIPEIRIPHISIPDIQVPKVHVPKMDAKHVHGDFKEKVEEPVHVSLAFPGARSLVMDPFVGNIQVQGNSGDRLEIHGTRTLWADQAADLDRARREVQFAPTVKDGVARAVVEGPWRERKGERSGRLPYSASYDLKVSVPQGVSLDLKGISGEWRIQNIHGEIKVSQVNGGLHLEGVTASLQARTVNGTIEAAFSQPPTQKVSLKTVNGDVKVRFPASLSADIKASSLNGEIVTDFEYQSNKGEGSHGHVGRSCKVRIGQGGPVVELETIQGDVVVAKSK